MTDQQPDMPDWERRLNGRAADEQALRDRIAEALYAWTLEHSAGGRRARRGQSDDTALRVNSTSRADAVMAAVMAAVQPEMDALEAQIIRDQHDAMAQAERAEQAEATIARVRRMAQVWIDIRPTRPTLSDYPHGAAYAGQQILAALDGTEP